METEKKVSASSKSCTFNITFRNVMKSDFRMKNGDRCGKGISFQELHLHLTLLESSHRDQIFN
jgi:hypothetical protein